MGGEGGEGTGRRIKSNHAASHPPAGAFSRRTGRRDLWLALRLYLPLSPHAGRGQGEGQSSRYMLTVAMSGNGSGHCQIIAYPLYSIHAMDGRNI